MSAIHSFVVLGPPGTKGSSKLFYDHKQRRVGMKPDNEKLLPWTLACAWAANTARVPKIPAGTGVLVEVTYELKPPKTWKKGKARTSPCIKPDVDKLARALLDALTGIAYDDDGQVVSLLVRKIYGPAPRTLVTLRSETT